MKGALRKLWSNRTARCLLLAGIALILLLICALVFKEPSDASFASAMTEEESRLSELLSHVEDAGRVRVYLTKDGGDTVGAVVLFDGEDGILVRLRLTQMAARALSLSEKEILVCPADR